VVLWGDGEKKVRELTLSSMKVEALAIKIGAARRLRQDFSPNAARLDLGEADRLPFVLDSPQDFPHKTSASRSSILAEKCLFVDVPVTEYGLLV
jgi:hypothetical protein